MAHNPDLLGAGYPAGCEPVTTPEAKLMLGALAFHVTHDTMAFTRKLNRDRMAMLDAAAQAQDAAADRSA